MFVRDLFQALSRARIQYCVVGGLAMNLHGARRRTYNVDLVVRLDSSTLLAMERVLGELGLECRHEVRLSELADTRNRRRLLVKQNLICLRFADPLDALRGVDVVVAPPLEPLQLLERAVARKLLGISVRVAALSDLMLMKRVSGWQKDAGDVARLERLKQKPRARRTKVG